MMEPVQLWTEHEADADPAGEKKGGYMVDGSSSAAGLKKALNLLDLKKNDVFTTLVRNWPFAWERRALYATVITISSCAGVSALVIEEMLRRQFLLGRLARIQAAVTAYGLTALFTTIGHYYFVFRPMASALASDVPNSASAVCPVCLELRQLAVNTLFGVALPMVTAPLHCMFIVSYCDLYDLPRLRNLSRWSRYVWSKLRPVCKVVPWILAGNAVLSSACVYAQYRLTARIIDAARDDPEIFLHLSTHHPDDATLSYWISRMWTWAKRKTS